MEKIQIWIHVCVCVCVCKKMLMSYQHIRPRDDEGAGLISGHHSLH